MAPRYRVGTGGNWNDTSHWAFVSGGSGGASVPGSSDNALFDSNTPVGTVTVDVAVDVVDMNCTGWTGTLDQNGYTMQVSGNWIVQSGMTFVGDGLVQFDGSGASQGLSMDGAYNTFDDLRNSITESGGYDLDLQTDIRVTGVFTIDSGCRVHANGNDIYIRGSGSGQLVLNGWIYCLSSLVVFEVNGGGTTYIPSATGWNVNGSLTGAVLRVEIISNVTATIRLAGDLSDILIFTIRSTSSGSGSTVTFYTDNYDIYCSVNINIGPDAVADACTFTSYWGSSTVQFTDNDTQFIRWQWDAATHNLQSAEFYGGTTGGGTDGTKGHFSVYGPSTAAVDTAQTFNPGTSTVRCRGIGESWMGLGSHDGVAECYDCVLSNPGAVAYIWIKLIATNKLSAGDNGSSAETDIECQAVIDVGELELDAVYSGLTFDFYETGQSDVERFDIAGTASYDVSIRSRVATSQADVALVNAATVSYTDVQDNNLSGANVNAYDGTNTDSGNNSSNWLFTEPAAAAKAYNYRRRRT